jgi:hypothetical protein
MPELGGPSLNDAGRTQQNVARLGEAKEIASLDLLTNTCDLGDVRIVFIGGSRLE